MLRARLLADRRGRTREAWRGIEERVVPRVYERLEDCATVGLYNALDYELSLARLAERLEGAGVKIAYPRCEPGRRLAFVAKTALSSWKPGPFGLLEPEGEALDAALLEAMVIPGLAFDRSGFRLGYGGGYYDRLLASYPGLTIGVAEDGHVFDRLPREAHDRAVQLVITESETLA